MVSFLGTIWPSVDPKKVQNWPFAPTPCFYTSPGICRRFWPEVLTQTPKNAVFYPRSYSKGPNHALEKVLTNETPGMHLMVYQWRPRQMAEVRSSQSQLHSVNGRSASGDRIILPLPSMSGVLGISEMFRNGTSFQQILISVEKELGASPPAHLQAPYGIPSGSGAESFFKAMSSSNSVRSMWSNGYRQELFEHTARYFRTGDASGPRCGLEKWTPNTHKAFFLIHLRFPLGCWHARHVIQLCIWLVHCLSLFVSKGDSLSRLHVPQDFHE